VVASEMPSKLSSPPVAASRQPRFRVRSLLGPGFLPPSYSIHWLLLGWVEYQIVHRLDLVCCFSVGELKDAAPEFELSFWRK
jgi:hypothetical protein